MSVGPTDENAESAAYNHDTGSQNTVPSNQQAGNSTFRVRVGSDVGFNTRTVFRDGERLRLKSSASVTTRFAKCIDTSHILLEMIHLSVLHIRL